MLIHPVRVPRWLESGLRLLAYTYLGAAVLFAAIGSVFLICRYDPFVGFFRLSGNWNILILGVSLLVIGLFVGRPYCRFLCPYGVILRQLSRLSKRRVTITPNECIKCRLCEDACPFGAIREPTEDWPEGEYKIAKRRLALFLVLLPVLVAAGGWAGYSLKERLARVHPMVRTAERVYLEESGPSHGDDQSPATRSERPAGPVNRSTSRPRRSAVNLPSAGPCSGRSSDSSRQASSSLCPSAAGARNTRPIPRVVSRAGGAISTARKSTSGGRRTRAGPGEPMMADTGNTNPWYQAARTTAIVGAVFSAIFAALLVVNLVGSGILGPWRENKLAAMKVEVQKDPDESRAAVQDPPTGPQDQAG